MRCLGTTLRLAFIATAALLLMLTLPQFIFLAKVHFVLAKSKPAQNVLRYRDVEVDRHYIKRSWLVVGGLGAIALLSHMFFSHGGIDLVIPAEDRLFIAVNENNLVRVKEILESGQVKNLNQGFGGFSTSALMRATEKGNLEIVKALIKAGAAVNYEAKGRETALHIAAYYGYLEVTKLLLLNGANPNVPLEQNALTPLHQAILKGHIDTAKLLVESGADVRLMTGDGRNAITMAHRLGNPDFTSWLDKYSRQSPDKVD